MVDQDPIEEALGITTGWSLERKLLVASLIVSTMGFVFALGVNWATIIQAKADIRALRAFNDDVLPRTYMRRDVYEADQHRLADSIDRLNAALAEHDQESRRVREWLKSNTR